MISELELCQMNLAERQKDNDALRRKIEPMADRIRVSYAVAKTAVEDQKREAGEAKKAIADMREELNTALKEVKLWRARFENVAKILEDAQTSSTLLSKLVDEMKAALKEQ